MCIWVFTKLDNWVSWYMSKYKEALKHETNKGTQVRTGFSSYVSVHRQSAPSLMYSKTLITGNKTKGQLRIF